MNPGGSPSSDRATRWTGRFRDVRSSSFVIAIAAAAFISAVVAVSAAVVTIDTTRPSDRELQRVAADELGLPGFLLDTPVAQAIADDITDRVAHRVIEESRPSVALGLTIGVLAGAATAATATAALVRLYGRRETDP